MANLIDTIIYAGRLKNQSALMGSSSGGVFTALSDYFLERGNAVVAVIYNYDSHTAEFKMILNKEQREKAKGSKYMQSKPGNIYRETYQWLMSNPNKKLLFVGMGCQAEGFRKFSELKGIRERVYVVDIICYGSPSPKLWREYAVSVEKRNSGNITYLTFKDKRDGWKSPTAYVKINGDEIGIKNYVKVFYNQCALRPSCHECPYAAIERKTDLTIGDFWHIDEKISDFYDPRGNSLLLIHTDCGRKLFEEIKEDIEYRLSNTTQCWQPNLEKPTKKSGQRDMFWKDYQRKGIDYIMKKYGTISLKIRIKNKLLKNFGGGELTNWYQLITPKGGRQNDELEVA